MRAGKLRHRVKLQAVSGTSWATVSTISAAIEPSSGSENYKGPHAITDLITIRYRSGVTALMRVKYGERIFFVRWIANTDERNRELKLLAEEQTIGTAVTFSRETTTEDEDTGITTPSTSTIAGNAFQVKDDPRRFETLGLSLSGHTTLYFTPSTLNESPESGDSVTWGGKPCSVEGVEQDAPAGTVIGAWVVIKR
jgi:SPP1 family predicted phage head-tail adaptor